MNPAFGINKMSNLSKPPFNFKIPDLIEPESPSYTNTNYNNYNNMNSNNGLESSGVCVSQPDYKKNKKGKFVNNINNNYNNHNNYHNHNNNANNANNINNTSNDISYKSFPKVDTYATICEPEVSSSPSSPNPNMDTNTNTTPNINIVTNELLSPESTVVPTSTVVSTSPIIEPSANAKSLYTSTNSNNILEHNWNHGYLVDPLSVIIKLSLLGKKEINTKISIINNAMQIHEVGLFQGITRFYYNSNKFDMYYLHTPIKLACVHFLLNKPTEDMDSLKKLFRNAIYGLEKLIITYKSHAIIGLCLNSYIDIIQNSILGTYNPTLYKEDDYSMYYTPEKMNKMLSIWSVDKLHIVLNMNEYIYTENKSIESIKSLETFMHGVDADIQRLIDGV